ncbi:Perilipin family [Popillia japonica]|uniref:Perilipin family n=1 Tax=Popillia japonica TaxID=7064 RepID=A0AAW1JGG2_POPJA
MKEPKQERQQTKLSYIILFSAAQPVFIIRIKENKMSVEGTSEQVQQQEEGINLEAVNRISKLPIVETTIDTATNIYTKVKDYNTVTNWTLSTAENTAHKAVEIAKPYATPIITQLKEPIQKVDGLLCTGLDYVEEKVPAVKLPPGEVSIILMLVSNINSLDYVEEKVPAVKLPPGEMYSGAKDLVTNTVGTSVETAKHMVEPAVETAKHTVEAAKHMVEPAIETAKHYVEPAVETAKHYIDPAVETAKHYIDPAVETAKHYIDPAVEKACAIKDYGIQQVDKFLHPNAQSDAIECEECQAQDKREGSPQGDM